MGDSLPSESSLEAADHPVKDAHERGPVRLGLVLTNDRLKLIGLQQLLDRAGVWTRWVLVVMELKDVHVMP